MPQFFRSYGIYAFTAGRDRAALQRFLTRFVNHEAFAVRYAGTTTHGALELPFAGRERARRRPKEERVSVRSFAALVDAVCARPAAVLPPVYLPPAARLPDLGGVALAGMDDGTLVFVLGIAANPGERVALARAPGQARAQHYIVESPGGVARAARWLRRLCRRCGCPAGYVTAAPIPRTPAERAEAAEDRALAWYPPRRPEDAPTHPRPVFRVGGLQPWEWMPRTTPPAAAAGWEWVLDFRSGRSFHPHAAWPLHREIAAFAADVVDGRLRLVAVAARLGELLTWCGVYPAHDPDAAALRRVEAALFDLLPEEVLARSHADDPENAWPMAIYADTFPEIARIEAWARAFGVAACERLVDRFGAAARD